MKSNLTNPAPTKDDNNKKSSDTHTKKHINKGVRNTLRELKENHPIATNICITTASVVLLPFLPTPIIIGAVLVSSTVCTKGFVNLMTEKKKNNRDGDDTQQVTGSKQTTEIDSIDGTKKEGTQKTTGSKQTTEIDNPIFSKVVRLTTNVTIVLANILSNTSYMYRYHNNEKQPSTLLSRRIKSVAVVASAEEKQQQQIN